MCPCIPGSSLLSQLPDKSLKSLKAIQDLRTGKPVYEGRIFATVYMVQQDRFVMQ